MTVDSLLKPPLTYEVQQALYRLLPMLATARGWLAAPARARAQRWRVIPHYTAWGDVPASVAVGGRGEAALPVTHFGCPKHRFFLTSPLDLSFAETEWWADFYRDDLISIASYGSISCRPRKFKLVDSRLVRKKVTGHPSYALNDLEVEVALELGVKLSLR